MLRLLKIFLVMQVALFFSIVAFSNLTDFGTNLTFVEHVLRMDTTFESPGLMWRAIDDSVIHKIAYFLIILTEISVAVILWVASIQLSKAVSEPITFYQKKWLANLGLGLGISLYLLGFVIIGGEWFAMWQSNGFNGVSSASRFISIQFFILIFLNLTEENKSV